MRAVVQHGIRDVRVEEWPEPSPALGEALIRIKSVTICASDIHAYAEGNVGGIIWDRAFVPGHEAAGIVIEPCGTDLPAGTMVVLDPASSCYECDMCARGLYHLCRDLKFLDLPPIDGAMREIVAWPAKLAYPVPNMVDISEAPLIEPLCVGIHAAELASELDGATVLVVGCGAIGLCTLIMAKLKGAERIFACDLIPERLSVAREMGADVTFEIGEQDPVGEALSLTEGSGVDVSFEAAGPQESLDTCLGATRPAGEVIVIGIPSEDEYRLNASRLRRTEMTLKFVRRQNENYLEAIDLVRRGKIKIEPMLTHRFPIERVKEAFDLAERKGDGAIRVAVLL